MPKGKGKPYKYPVVLVCTYCKHPYIVPCNGEKGDCANKRYVDNKKKPKGISKHKGKGK